MPAATATRKRATRRKPATDTADRTIEWAKLLDQALTTPGSVGNVYNRFYNYSFLNCLLLMMQGATEPVATYDRWQKMGRQVRKGEKAKEIVRPITVKIKDEDDADKVRMFQKFKHVRCLFEYSQTDGEELPPFEIPYWNVGRAHLALNIHRIAYDSLDGNTQGYSRERGYALNPVAVYPEKTRMHEIAHIMLGHTTQDFHAEYVLHRGLAEFQAEATAFLVMKELDVLTDEMATVSRGYVQGWLGSNKPSDAAVRAVFKAVTEITRAGRPTTDDIEPANAE